MKNNEMIPAELIYKAAVRFVGTTEFGASMGAFASGQTQIPPGGMRFDQEFEGDLLGPRIEGTIHGIDYLNVRADGLFQMHLHARVRTRDGANIALSSRGISVHIPDDPVGHVRSAVSLFSSDTRYQWVNRLHLWAMGPMDPMNGTATIKAYSI